MTEDERWRLPNWVGSALTVIAAMSAASVIWFLADQNLALKSALAAMPGSGQTSGRFAVGDVLPDVPLGSTAGEEQSLHELTVGPVSVIGIMTTTCPYCEENLDNWERLERSLGAANIPFVAVSLNSIEEVQSYSADHVVDWVRWAANPAEFGRPMAVPTTVLVGRGGEVLASITGVLGSLDLDRLEGQALALSRSTP